MKKTLAILLSFLLTGALILFAACFIARQLLAPGAGDNGAQVSDAVIRYEQELIREHVTALADMYGFTAQPVNDAITEETLRDLHSQAALWWNCVLRDGKPGAEIDWEIEEIETILATDEALQGNRSPEEAQTLAASAAEEIHRSVNRVVLPIRQQVMRLGMKEAGKRVDLPNLIEFFLGLPRALLALCVLLAGLIALLQVREPRSSLYHIGSALGASALVLAVMVILFLCTGVRGMILEASGGLTIQYDHVATLSLIRILAITVILLAGSIICLKAGGKRREVV